MKGNLQLGLFVLRLSVFLFFAVWAIEKFIKPETTAAIYSHFYMIEGLPVFGAYAAGTVQLIVLAGFLLGIAKFWTYGLLLVMHTLSTLSTWQQLIAPYDGSNHLFIAAIPTLAGIFVLFLMRDEDTMFNPFAKGSGSDG